MYFSKRVDREMIRNLKEIHEYTKASQLLMKSIRYNLDRMEKCYGKDEELESLYVAFLSFTFGSSKGVSEDVMKGGLEMIMLLEKKVALKMHRMNKGTRIKQKDSG